jgi:hypothetical protein
MKTQAKVRSVASVEWAAIHGMSEVQIVLMADPISIVHPSSPIRDQRDVMGITIRRFSPTSRQAVVQ